MNENGKNDNNENYIKKNLKPSFNQIKTSQNKPYIENNQSNLIKENIYNYNLYKLSSNDSFENINENPNEVVSKILDNINKNNLSTFYDSDSEFKNKIDSLNLKFYLETEKYLCNQNKKIQTQTSLFIILFKQIIIYIKEIERLNLIIIKKKYKPENIIKRTDDIEQKQKEFQAKEDIINALKKSQSNMESKLLQAIINENNLNKKIEQLQTEIEFYRNKINIRNSNNDLNIIKIDKTMSISFNNDKKEELYDRYKEDNDNLNNNTTSNDIKTNKKKNSHNSACITNSSNSRIKNIIKISKSINIKSKSPTNYNIRKSSFRHQNFKNINPEIKRNHSEKDDKLRNNNKTNKQNINKNNIKKQNVEEMKYKGYLITDLIKNENININNKKIKPDKIDKNSNTIEILETDPDIIKGNNFKKIIITNKNKFINENNITFRNTKKSNNNLKLDLLLSNSNLSNNINNSKKQKNDFNMNKCIYTCYNTIGNYTSKYKSDNAFNCFKLINNKKKLKFDNHNIINNIHKSNNNVSRVNNKNILNEQKSNSLLKKEKNKQRIKNIINISSSIGYKKEINGNQSKKS